ncbi:hypothetical protein LG307_16715 [Sutcliffiella horikoshii]|uniref:hypothetical protein n=1 Tax=Sutcliffiella horikoshii TaxID=79883 RepID=UPI00384B1274
MDEDVEFIRNYEFGKDKISLYEPGKQFLVRESGPGPLDEDLSNFTPIILKDEHFKLRIPFSYLEVLS